MKKPDFKSQFSQYSIIITQDGSRAINSDYFAETSHSLSGARQETMYNFIKGCKVEQKLRQLEQISILEVGFATGLGAVCTYEALKHLNKPVQFMSLEIDPELVTWSMEQGPYHESLQEICNSQFFKLKVLSGDARDTIQSIKQKFHAIYQDPYSPKRNPSLWTKEWFTDLKKLSHDDCLLSTYSASARMRISLVKAGWDIKNQKGFAQKKSMTIASSSPFITDSVAHEYLNHKLSPFQDSEL